MIEETLQDLFPQFSTLKNSTGRAILDKRNLYEFPVKTTLFRQGDQCQSYYLVIEGIIRVFSRAENGREIALYKIERGESCVLTTSCLLGKQRYPAEGVADTNVKVLAIPGKSILEAIDKSRVIREFVFASHSERLSSLISFVGEVVFSKIDLRLAKYILNNIDSEKNLLMTHQRLAMELGSAREVISRQLKEFERRKLISMSRGEIHLINKETLREIAAGI